MAALSLVCPVQQAERLWESSLTNRVLGQPTLGLSTPVLPSPSQELPKPPLHSRDFPCALVQPRRELPPHPCSSLTKASSGDGGKTWQGESTRNMGFP